MARKNILSGLMDDSKKFTAVNSGAEAPAPEGKPQSAYKGIGALGAVTRSIDALAAKADAAREIEAKLIAGEVVIDLDPDQLEASFVSDRMVQEDEQFQALVEAMRSRGQDSPILVRPHPQTPGRYQIAFGHRRARAASVLGRPVRAVVKKLDDRDHVIAQGQENSARADLSFIERTMFAARLNTMGFDRETIMSALSADKTTVSKMISVVTRIPADILGAIGAAQAIGRDRWHELSALFDKDGNEARARGFVAAGDLGGAEPNERFNRLAAFLGKPDKTRAATPKAIKRAARWKRSGGAEQATISDNGKQFTIALTSGRASDFGAYIADNLDRLYDAFQKVDKA